MAFNSEGEFRINVLYQKRKWHEWPVFADERTEGKVEKQNP